MVLPVKVLTKICMVKENNVYSLPEKQIERKRKCSADFILQTAAAQTYNVLGFCLEYTSVFSKGGGKTARKNLTCFVAIDI